MTTLFSPELHLSVSTESDRPVLEQLWQMFRHDMSAYSGALPDERGRFRQERLDSALHDDTGCGYLLRLGSAPIGFCLVQGVDSAEKQISSFFLVNSARRHGHARAAVQAVMGRPRGRWAVAFHQANQAAAAFWPSVAARNDAGWTRTLEPVPGRPDLPPDAWIRFTAGQRG